MNRERGASSLILALLILILGSLLLQGVKSAAGQLCRPRDDAEHGDTTPGARTVGAGMGAGAAMVRRNRNGMSALFPFRSEGLFAEIIGG